MERFLELVKKDGSKILGLTFGKKTVAKGQYVPRSEATSAPEIAFAVKSPLAKYIVICLDPDGPFPSFNVLSPILHWIQSDFKVAASTDTLTTTEPFIANYIGPGPPPGSFPHRYVFLLYEQPSDFNSRDHAPPGGKPFGTWARMRWDLPAWEKRAKLDRPVAVGYFTSN